MPKINNADKCLVSRSGDRVLHCTKASKLRDECPEYPSATGLKLQRNNAALRSAADAK
jgi:hypothetical protein